MIKKGILTFVLFAIAKTSLLKIVNLHYELEFQSWMSEYKLLALSPSQYSYRLQIFSSNLDMIQKHNNRQLSYTLGLNQFAHLTFKEFSDKYLGKPKSRLVSGAKSSKFTKKIASSVLKHAQSVNWVSQGKVSPVEDQKTCGSCYDFASVAAAESYHAIFVDPTNPPPILSKQYMVDCGRTFSPLLNGCQGGEFEPAMNFLKSQGVPLQSDYPYLAYQNDTCPAGLKIFTRVKGVEHVESGVQNLLTAIEKRPVPIGYEFTASLVFYKSGIYQTFAPCGFNVNHAMLAVGYDLTDNIPYYLIRNSYGVTWGEQGYFKLAIGNINTKGMCMVAGDEIYAPVMDN